MKKIKFLVFVLVCMFVSTLNVKAISCTYKNGNDTITISINEKKLDSKYVNKSGSSQPFFPMNLVDGPINSMMFNNDAGDQTYVNSKGQPVEACPNAITNFYENNPFDYKPSVGYMSSTGFMAGYSNPMKMPVVFFSEKATTSNNEEATIYPIGGIRISAFSNYKSITYSLESSKSEIPEQTSDGFIKCNYKNKNTSGLYNFKFKTNGDFIGHQYAYNNSEKYTSIKQESNQRDPIKKCPDVIKLNSNKTTFSVSSMDACYYDDASCFYEESVSPYYGNAGTLITSYTDLSGSGSKISVYNDDSTIKVSTGNGNTEINVTNLSEYSSVFQSKQKGEYPKYLINYKSGTYTFVKELPENKEDISKTYRVSSLDVPEIKEEAYKTCEDLFGQSFLKWLDDNVFMLIRIAVPILLILLTTIDFAKVVFTDDKEGMQNAFKRFIKRAIAAVLIFLTPTIIILVATLIDPEGNDLGAVTDCVRTIESISESQSAE